jgi:penicillin amidase
LDTDDFGPAPRHRSRGERLARLALSMLLVALVLASAGGLWVHARLRASLPRESGSWAAPGLGAAVEVERDAQGVPTVRAASEVDAAEALGFLHAQERFFQMDLLRRLAAGELAELMGGSLVPVDRDHRLHRCRAVAEASLRRAGPRERALVEAYTRGVNAGLAALGEMPPEYLLLRAAPARWQAADSYLAVLAMFFSLNDSHGTEEARLGEMRARLPAPLFDFLEPQGTEWDAPLLGDALPVPPIPGPEVLDLRRRAALLPAAGSTSGTTLPFLPIPADSDWGLAEDIQGLTGSNNWAVSGAHTADGHALLANDMHLGLGLPNIWYRAALRWRAADGSARQMTGVTLPGTPGVTVGSNGHVAWGFTNSYGDYGDLVDLEADPSRPDDPDVYKTPNGPRHLEHRREVIHVHGGQDVEMDVEETLWGPLLPAGEPDRRPGEGAPSAHPRQRRALAWIAHDPAAVNLVAFALVDARTVEEAIEAAHGAGIPPQNFTVVDDHGHIGWTIMGRIPRRVGFDGRTPTSWADGSHRWDGWLTSPEVPKVIDPPAGRIWTANARTVGGELLARLGDGGYNLGARARQIRDDLLALEAATPRDLLAVQLDDRALFLTHWHDLLLATLDPEKARGEGFRGELRALVAGNWDGHAGVASAGYRAVRAFRDEVATKVFASLVPDAAPAGGLAAPQEPRLVPGRQFEGPLWRLVSERPPHLLDPHFRTWDDFLLAAADTVAATTIGPQGMAARTWGERNTLVMHHPLSRAAPFLGRWLDLAPRQLPGDRDMPRVQSPAAGASERLVVSPGQEEKGLFEMPGGESGHFLSPHYGDGERAWERGDPTPFLPGPAVATLRLVPAAAGGR